LCRLQQFPTSEKRRGGLNPLSFIISLLLCILLLVQERHGNRAGSTHELGALLVSSVCCRSRMTPAWGAASAEGGGVCKVVELIGRVDGRGGSGADDAGEEMACLKGVGARASIPTTSSEFPSSSPSTAAAPPWLCPTPPPPPKSHASATALLLRELMPGMRSVPLVLEDGGGWRRVEEERSAACVHATRLLVWTRACTSASMPPTSSSMPPCRNIIDPSLYFVMETKHAELHASDKRRTSSDERGRRFFTTDPDAGYTTACASAFGASAGMFG
jgi:hypothetical protein